MRKASLKSLLDICKEVFDKRAAIKQKYFRQNYSPFFDKQVLRANKDQ